MKKLDTQGVIADLPPTRRAALILGMAVLCASVLLSVIDTLTEPRINTARTQLRLDTLAAVLPPGPFDNNPVESVKQHTVQSLGGAEPLDIYTAYTSGRPAAAVLELLAPDGYSGNIRLLLGLKSDGTIVGARVIEHRETPGLGDAIDTQRSDWIMQFNGRSLNTDDTADENADADADADADDTAPWQPGPSNTQIDAVTGATITSRAVLQAIHRALQWFELNREAVFSQ